MWNRRAGGIAFFASIVAKSRSGRRTRCSRCKCSRRPMAARSSSCRKTVSTSPSCRRITTTKAAVGMLDLIAPASASAWHALADPWGQAIVRRAFLEIGLIGLLGGPLGCWIVFYGLSYSAESLAHGLFPGLVVAALTGIPLLLGGAVGIAIAALAVAVAARAPALGRDTSVAVVVTGLFGLGALLALSAASPPGL